MVKKQHKPFPKDFLWGASTSAYQCEGASDLDGKGPSVQDVKTPFPGTPDFKVASDHYHRYKEDIALMAEMGFKVYRFSISWSRVIPTGDGPVNPQGVAFYSNLINECLKYGIEPLVTMFHFDLPQALAETGGWGRRECADAFVRFAKVLFENFGDRVKYWLTINEQNMLTLVGPLTGTFNTEGVANIQKELYQQNHHMMLAQARAMALCHEMVPGAKIGPAPNISAVYPASCKPEDITAAGLFSAIRNWFYLDMASTTTRSGISWRSRMPCPRFSPVIWKFWRAAIPISSPSTITALPPPPWTTPLRRRILRSLTSSGQPAGRGSTGASRIPTCP